MTKPPSSMPPRSTGSYGTLLPPAPAREIAPATDPVVAPISTPAPASESTATGPSGMLPANPFADLSPSALEHFVDCTVYEETGPLPIGVGPAAALVELGLVPSEPISIKPQESQPTPVAPVVHGARPIRSVGVVVAVIFGAGGILVGYHLHGSRSRDVPRAVETIPPSASPAAAVVKEAAPTRTETPPSVTPATCQAAITSRPRGALVSWAGRVVGATPLQHVSVPCGRSTVVLRHPEFVRVEREVDATPDAPATLAVELVHPPARLDLVSTPPGATFVVAGATIGKAPTSCKVVAFKQVAVSATLPGFKPWTQKVYVKARRMDLRARLEPIAKHP